MNRTLLVLFFSCLSCAALAQGDPTRPSAAWLAAQERGAGKQAPVEAASNEAQIVVTRAKGAFVVIDGKVVRPGEEYNGARLLRVGEEGAVWQRGDVREAPGSPAIVKTAVKQKRNTNGGESR